MKRSTVNAILRSAEAFLTERRFHLPPFAYWTPEDWGAKGPDVRGIVDDHLGWDITDFGSGRFRECGLVLFTLRNGKPENLKTLRGKTYAEKIMVVDVDQVTPMHFHWTKTEDIINRGGGTLQIQLYNAAGDDTLAATDVSVQVDASQRIVSAGSILTLHPGESITLPNRLYHQFWGAEERVLVGEVSLVNDDHADNRFLEPAGRFPAIEEDASPLHLLCNEYARYYRG